MIELFPAQPDQFPLDLLADSSVGRLGVAGRRVKALVGSLDLADGQMSVNLRGLQADVAEHFLDVSEIAAVTQETRGKGMTKVALTASYPQHFPLFS